MIVLRLAFPLLGAAFSMCLALAPLGAQVRVRPPVRTADIMGIARALVDSVRTTEVRALLGASDDSLSRELARLLRVPFVVRTSAPSHAPPCPWGDPPKGALEPGYMGSLSGVERFRSDTAGGRLRVIVFLSCDNPPGYLHDIFFRSQTYILARAGKRWKIVELGGMSIT